jgi:glycosyltransferase involved in cell wall biosynthesis
VQDVTKPNNDIQTGSNNRSAARKSGLPWRHYASRSLRLMQHGQGRLLFGKLLQILRATVLPGISAEKLLAWAEADGRPLALIIDHELGGGANLFRERLVEDLAKADVIPLILSLHYGVPTYQLACRRDGRIRHAYPRQIEEIFSCLSRREFREAYLNNILSFPRPIEMLEALSAWLCNAQSKPAFTFFVHDYYSVCPSWLLLDYTGHYCGIPDQTVCATCLPANPARFIDFANGTDVSGWRMAWSKLLSLADEIRCFSESSRMLLRRAFPQGEGWNVTVVPHDPPYPGLRKVTLADSGWPVIGVIGHLSDQKGGRIVCELAEHILATGSNARLVIIGTIEEKLPPSVTCLAGPYSPCDLPDIVEHHGINVALFPSICPETFSFVVAEIMAMELPLLCFDLGAPAERTARYNMGLVLPSMQAEEILDGAFELYRTHVQTLPAPS